MKAGTDQSPASGQALVELLASTGLILLVLLGGMSLFKAAWLRIQCARISFTHAHSALLGEGSGADVTESESEVVAAARCGRISERVAFSKLEAEP